MTADLDSLIKDLKREVGKNGRDNDNSRVNVLYGKFADFYLKRCGSVPMDEDAFVKGVCEWLDLAVADITFTRPDGSKVTERVFVDPHRFEQRLP